MENNLNLDIFKKNLLKRLPAIPRVVHEVWELINKGDASPSTISNVISKDITLSAKVLHLVNSPFYGFPNRIASIKHAVVLLGLDAIKGLLISTIIFGDINQDIKESWSHACDCAAVSGIIGRFLDIKEVDELTVAGLLHDMGKVVLKNYFPEYSERIKMISKLYNLSEYESEKKVIGVSHDVINEWITEKWNFPPILRETLIYHHNVKGSGKYPEFAAIVSLADLLCHVYRLESNDKILPTLEDEVCEILDLDPEILYRIISEMDKSLYSSYWDDL